MRKFSEREKEIIRRLVEGASGSFVYLPINAYGDIFYREKVEFVYQSTAELRFYSQQGSVRGTDDIFKVSSEIYEISYLIDYLEKEGMLRHFSIGTGTLKNNISGFNKAGLTGLSVALDPAVGEMLYANLNYPVYITPTLESLVKDNFKTLEEQTLDEAGVQTKLAKKQTLLSLLAVILAMLTLLLGLMQGCKGCSGHDEANTGINGEAIVPLTGLINYFKNNIEGKLDATMNNTADIRMELQDTVTVNVAKCPCKKRLVRIMPTDSCKRTIRINICEDTVVSKQGFKK